MLAERGGWRLRSVYRDIEAIEKAGIPIEREDGRYRVMSGWTPPGRSPPSRRRRGGGAMQRTELFAIDGPGWVVFEVTTASSRYCLGLHRGKRLAVLRGHSSGLGHFIDARDREPTLDGRPLFDLPPETWPGGRLEVGTTVTSPIRAVVRVGAERLARGSSPRGGDDGGGG
jgi:hypothetical protein